MKRWHAWAAMLFPLALALPALAAPARPPAPRPALVVETLDGKTFDLAAERGHWVIVNFWATWCSPCIAEMPDISRYVKSHPQVRAIGLAWDRAPAARIVAFARSHPVDYPLARMDVDRAPGGFAAPAGLPMSYLVAPDGHVAHQFIGPVNGPSLDAAIAAAKAASARGA